MDDEQQGRAGSLLLVDLNTWGGHHQAYLKEFSRIILDQGHRLEVLCVAPERMRTFLGDVCTDERRWYVHDDATPRGLPGRLKLLALLNRCAHRTVGRPVWGSDYALGNHLRCRLAERKRVFGQRSPVFFCDVDCMLSAGSRVAMQRVFPGQWGGLYVKPLERMARLMPPSGRDNKASAEQAFGMASCRVLCLLDEGVVPAYAARYATTQCVALPEPCGSDDTVTGRDDAALIAAVDAHISGRCAIGLLGHQIRRKNLLGFMDVAEQLERRDWAVFVVGDVPAQEYSTTEMARIEAFLKGDGSRVFWRQRGSIPVATFDQLLSRMTVAYLCYRDFAFSSNMLAKAALLRVPAVVSSGYLMAERVERYGLGYVVQQGDGKAQLSSVLASPRFAYDEGKIASYTHRLTGSELSGTMAEPVLRVLLGGGGPR